jgi:ABC-type antimicrobial peptide transport system permease subunit
MQLTYIDLVIWHFLSRSIGMLKSYLKTALRNFFKNKLHSIINMAGLSVGMAVALLIGLWIWDEGSFDTYHSNHQHIAQVMENQSLDNGIQTMDAKPMPLAKELRSKYPDDFKYVAACISFEQVVASEDKKMTRTGSFAEADFAEMMTLKMINGSRSALKDASSILLSRSLAALMFGNADPIDKIVKLGNEYTLQVKGVYEDLPANTTYKDISFIAPIHQLFKDSSAEKDWYTSAFTILVQLNPGSDFKGVSAKIKDLLYEHNKNASKPQLFLYPMDRWHLYSEFKNGVAAGGKIRYVWVFGLTAIFILLLASINFMNLSTARSEKRAREVGIRKAVGSSRGQLISQFFSESFLMVICAFALSLVLVELILPFFNEVAGKKITILWDNAYFWLSSLGFILFTGFLTGSYPAFYLSSFNPVKVLKGTVRVGRLAAVPRKVLVVVQFTVSVGLAIGAIIVYREIQFAKDRPLGYTQNGLITIPLNIPAIHGNYDALRSDLMVSGAISDMALSSSPTTGIWSSANNLSWRGKDPNRQAMFGTLSVSSDFGKTIGWKIMEGRDFSSALLTDSAAFILNEAAVKLTGLKSPLREQIRWHGKTFAIIGVVKDMVMTSPFLPTAATVFMMNRERNFQVINIKLNPNLPSGRAIDKIKVIFSKYNPDALFEYRFADQEYAKKFADEQRVGKLVGFFSLLAIFISCIGIFGMASFMAEQRTKEIGVRKVLGASIMDVWGLLSRDFVILVIIAMLIATPIAYYIMHNWLQHYDYRVGIPWWIFAMTGVGALLLTLLTVSYQAIRAAMANPVKSLRTD